MMESRQDEIYLRDLAVRWTATCARRASRRRRRAGLRRRQERNRQPGPAKTDRPGSLGGHGHKGLLDWLHGETITGVRHGLTIPILA